MLVFLSQEWKNNLAGVLNRPSTFTEKFCI